MKRITPHRKASGRTSIAALGLAFVLIGGGAATAADRVEAARVLGVKGSALAQSPGEEPRALRYDSPIYAGDKLVTAKESGLGLLSGTHYVGLDEATTAVLGLADTGAPDVEVQAGRIRLLDSGDGAAARLATRGLQTANAGSDTDVFAFPEKAGLVSMICPTEGDVTATRGPEALTVGPGECAVAKRGEPLYAASAGHPPLALLADSHGFQLAGDPVGRLGTPLPPVALGLAPITTLGSSPDAFSDDPRLPCDEPSDCTALRAGGMVPNPPTNPPQPGGPPVVPLP